MKGATALLCFSFFPLFSFSQSCANYTVARTTGITYTSIVGTGTSNFIWRNTVTPNSNDDNRSYATPLGFDFWYLGVRYTTFCAALNGYIDFSSSAATGDGHGLAYGSNYTGAAPSNSFQIGGTAGATMLAAAPMYGDLWTAGSASAPIATSLVYKLSGAAPNRVMTVEWINFDEYGSSTGSLNMQVKIYEATGVIEFIYGTMTAGTQSRIYCCGINNYWNPAAAPTAAQLLNQSAANSATFNNTAQNSITTLPTSNSKITFTPPTPTAAPTGLNFTAVSKVGMTLNWTDNATNEVGYVIYKSTDGVNYYFNSQIAANSVSSAISGLFPGTTYYWKVYAVTDGCLTSALTGTQATLPPINIISIASTSWNTTTTWDCTCIPSAGDNVTIANGNTVTMDVDGACHTLTVGQGASGQLTIGNDATSRTLTVNVDVTINAGGTLTVGALAPTAPAIFHSLSMLTGNIINSGTLDLAPTATRICNTTFSNNGNQTISGAGATTRFNRMTLNMGTSSTNILEITSTNFAIGNTNFLTLTNGTFKLSTATATLTPFTGATTMPLSTGIWINNAGATISSTGGAITLFGSLRATAGTLNVGSAANNNITSNGGTIVVDGGTINVAGAYARAGLTTLSFFTMSSGTFKVATVSSTTAGISPFMISETGSTFDMSGGTIIIHRSGAGNLGYLNTGGTVGSVIGGTLQIGDGTTPASTIQINSSISIYNLSVTNGAGAVVAQLVTNNLTVLNNFTINSGTFNPAALNFTVNGSSYIYGTFGDGTVAGTSTLGNNAADDVDLSGGTINGAATGVMNINGTIKLPTGNGTIGRITLTVATPVTVPTPRTLTLNNDNGIKTFQSLVTIDAGATWTSTTVSTTGNLVFINGIVNNGTSFSAGGASFNTTAAQSISGSTALSFANIFTVGAGVTLTNNGTVNLTNTGAGVLAGGGNWIQGVNSTLNYSGTTGAIGGFDPTANGNTVNYNSAAAAQTLYGFTYYNLTLSNSFGTAPQYTYPGGGPIVVTNTLNMSSGIVNLAGGSITLGSAGVASTLTRAANTWLYGGIFTRHWLSGVAVTSANYGLFPVGESTASSYSPIEINSSASPGANGTFSVLYTPNAGAWLDLNPYTVDGAFDIDLILQSSFTTSYTGLTSGTFDIYATMTGLPNVGVTSDIRLANFTGGTTAAVVGTHSAATGTVVNPRAGRTAVALASMNGDFRLGTINKGVTPLPVEFLEFNAKSNGSVVDVNWSTAAEFNSDYFMVQRSQDGILFEDVVQVKAAGNSSTVKKYSSADTDPYPGISYYRLKQVDFDGKYMFSDVVAVNMNSDDAVSVYPNPASGPFNLSITGTKGEKVVLVIRDVLGKEFYSEVIILSGSSEVIAIDPSGKLARGVYTVVISSSEITRTKKLVIK